MKTAQSRTAAAAAAAGTSSTAAAKRGASPASRSAASRRLPTSSSPLSFSTVPARLQLPEAPSAAACTPPSWAARACPWPFPESRSQGVARPRLAGSTAAPSMGLPALSPPSEADLSAACEGLPALSAFFTAAGSPGAGTAPAPSGLRCSWTFAGDGVLGLEPEPGSARTAAGLPVCKAGAALAMAPGSGSGIELVA